MKDYLLVTVVKGSLGNAGPKAPRDICKILKQTGKVDTVFLTTEKGMDFPIYLKLNDILKQATNEKRKVILQYPLQPYLYHEMQDYYSKLFELLDSDKTIILLHDINQIRFSNREIYSNEMKWLSKFHNFIIHNEKMEQYLRKYLKIDRCIQIKIFDYICEEDLSKETGIELSKNTIRIVFAGNLDSSKAPFLYNLQEQQMNFHMNIYGRRTDLIKNTKINYCGSFEADVLPSRLRGDLGLIWDGEIDSQSDTSAQKNYTRYNTPHKFSCYIAAGIPVIAWEESAIAELIRKYHIGYLIQNLYEINELNLCKYQEYKNNVLKLRKKVCSGYFTKTAFKTLCEAYSFS